MARDTKFLISVLLFVLDVLTFPYACIHWFQSLGSDGNWQQPIADEDEQNEEQQHIDDGEAVEETQEDSFQRRRRVARTVLRGLRRQ